MADLTVEILKQIRDGVNGLRTEMNGLRTEVNGLRVDVKANTGRIEQLSAEFSAMRADFQRGGMRADIENRVSALEEKVDMLLRKKRKS